MVVAVRLFWCLFFAFALICSARSTMFLSGEELVVIAGRSLKVNLDDYNEASANHGHDPRSKSGGGYGNGHRGHENP